MLSIERVTEPLRRAYDLEKSRGDQ